MLFEVPSSMKNMDEDIVYSVTERHSGKASQPTTARCVTVTTIIMFPISLFWEMGYLKKVVYQFEIRPFLNNNYYLGVSENETFLIGLYDS
jgi:hypothetical protein